MTCSDWRNARGRCMQNNAENSNSKHCLFEKYRYTPATDISRPGMTLVRIKTDRCYEMLWPAPTGETQKNVFSKNIDTHRQPTSTDPEKQRCTAHARLKTRITMVIIKTDKCYGMIWDVMACSDWRTERDRCMQTNAADSNSKHCLFEKYRYTPAADISRPGMTLVRADR